MRFGWFLACDVLLTTRNYSEEFQILGRVVDCEFLHHGKPSLQKVPASESLQVALRPAFHHRKSSQNGAHEPRRPRVAH